MSEFGAPIYVELVRYDGEENSFEYCLNNPLPESVFTENCAEAPPPAKLFSKSISSPEFPFL